MNLSQLDYQWFQAINDLASKFAALNPLMAFCADNLDYLFYLGVIVYWFRRTPDIRRMVFNALVSAAAALGTNSIIGSFYHRDRPFVAHHVIQLVHHEASASFPSNHAAAAFAVAASIWLWRRKDGRVWFILAALIGFSRIWSGIHYPMDIIGGAILGILIAVLIGKLMRWQLLKWLSESLIRIYESVEIKVWKPQKTK
ncbi:undecaprenyl-diphosphatase [Paenibacillus alginolyticus]|uniref:Undecaprenyl-diphosphatase n=1 Tax=Paenibacillus alginolyticus TaxID=59839 RepID=A0ABT4GMT7_9BACL|nr:undecaprenyl-diphosphatase [Paenibacillus alginolyticus]MCY9667308.1 undecaprenyl-diphosphatase [Paenibacillus alginolyticus]MCY9697535.1 undecaprenyl-diphosphatase [Paenibacillus alginolyticus]MEC0142001.1 undecaprenyl-diphosphatase [Paenibacillus alginolyticus]